MNKNYNDMTEEEKLKAIKEDWRDIDLIEDPSEAVQMEAVKRGKNALFFIGNPHPNVLLYVKMKEEL